MAYRDGDEKREDLGPGEGAHRKRGGGEPKGQGSAAERGAESNDGPEGERGGEQKTGWKAKPGGGPQEEAEAGSPDKGLGAEEEPESEPKRGGGEPKGEGRGEKHGNDEDFSSMVVDPERHFGTEPLFEDRRARILVWYVLPGILVLLLAALIATSRWNLDVTLYVFGQADPAAVHPARRRPRNKPHDILKHRAPVKHPPMMLRSGAPGALRLVVFRKLGSKLLHPLRGTLRLKGQKRSWNLFEGRGTESLEARFLVPKVQGRFQIDAEVDAPGGLRKTTMPVKIVPKLAWPSPVALETAMTMPQWDRPEPDREGTIVELVPSGGWSVPGEVWTRMVVRITDAAGRPKVAEARVGLLRGLSGNKGPGSVLMSWRKTGPDGLAWFKVMSRQPLLALAVEYRTAEGHPVHRYHFQFATRPVQASLLGAGRLAPAGKRFVLEAHSVLQSGVLYLDGYHEGTLTWMDRAKLERAQALFQVPAPKTEGLWFLQVYSDLVDPGQAVSTWASYVVPDGKPLDGALASRIVRAVGGVMKDWAGRALSYSGEDAARFAVHKALSWEAARMAALADWVATADQDAAERVVDYALGRLEGFSFPPEMLADTLPGERLAILSRRHRIQIVLLAFFFVGLAVFLALLGWVLLRQVQAGRNAAAEIARLANEPFDAGDGQGRPGASPVGGRGPGAASGADSSSPGLSTSESGEVLDSDSGKWTLRLQTLAVVFVILFAIASMIVLLTNLMWGL